MVGGAGVYTLKKLLAHTQAHRRQNQNTPHHTTPPQTSMKRSAPTTNETPSNLQQRSRLSAPPAAEAVMVFQDNDSDIESEDEDNGVDDATRDNGVDDATRDQFLRTAPRATAVFPPPGSADEANYPGLYRGPVDPRDVDFRSRGRPTAPAATGVFYPEHTQELLDELKTRLERTVLDANMTKSLRLACLTALMEVEDADNPYLQRALSEGEN